MIAITVSTNYDDLLNIILPQNYKFFEKWFIITDKNDSNTIDVIHKYKYDNIQIVYFNFYENGKVFNKGGAIKYCQEKLINPEYNGDVLLIDSDIYLPDNFIEIVNSISLQDETLYGTFQRFDFYSFANFKSGNYDFEYPWSKEFQGYFQLYKYKKEKLYEESFNCSECDLKFQQHFHYKYIIQI
jgi:hypothetical protein